MVVESGPGRDHPISVRPCLERGEHPAGRRGLWGCLKGEKQLQEVGVENGGGVELAEGWAWAAAWRVKREQVLGKRRAEMYLRASSEVS